MSTTAQSTMIDVPSVLSNSTTEVNLFRTERVAALEVRSNRDAVLDVLPAVYDGLGFPLGTVDTQAGVVGGRATRVRGAVGKTRLSQLVDCGTGAMNQSNADLYEVQLTILTLVAPVDSAHSTVQTRVRGVASPVGTGGQVMQCTTTGWAEDQIQQRLQARLQQR